MKNIIAWKFTDTERARPEINETVQEFIAHMYNGRTFGVDNTLESGLYKVAGWCFDLRGHLKIYLVQDAHNPRQWTQYYAPNKTALRRVIGAHKNKIVEVLL